MKNAIEESGLLADLFQKLTPTPAAYLKAGREIENGSFDELKPLRVAFLATFTANILKPYLIVEGARRGLKIEPYFAPFNQLEQQVFDSKSELYKFKASVLVIATRLEDIAQNLTDRFLKLSALSLEVEVNNVETRLKNLLTNTRQNTNATILLFNFSSPEYLSAGLADPSLALSQNQAIQRINEQISKLANVYPDVYIFDQARLIAEFGLEKWFDSRLWHMGKIPFGAEAQIRIGERLARYFRACTKTPCKCLVLDLDHVLWGGIVGEDGLSGISLGNDYPGSVYKEFQRRLLALKDRGILLAIASKNNEADALAVFEKHPDMQLKLQDFAAHRINWQDKAENLQAIAKELNLGTDSLAFFDDSPIEREWIRKRMPEVSIVEVPQNPLGYFKALEQTGAFDQLKIHDEDRSRAILYQEEGKRKELRSQTCSLDDFLKQLELNVTFGYINDETLPRVAQLIGKTNQFNLTTRRHNAAEIKSLLEKKSLGLWVRAQDRFGDYGLIGAVIVVSSDAKSWHIDTFLLSCRVIGRRIEDALLNVISREVRKKGGEILIGEYIPTVKNQQVADFYPTKGFESIKDKQGLWCWVLDRGELPLPDLINVQFQP